jgi:hypothetical protein
MVSSVQSNNWKTSVSTASFSLSNNETDLSICFHGLKKYSVLLAGNGLFDYVGSTVWYTECLLIKMIWDSNTQVRTAVYSLIIYKLTKTTLKSHLVGVGGYLARPVRYIFLRVCIVKLFSHLKYFAITNQSMPYFECENKRKFR